MQVVDFCGGRSRTRTYDLSHVSLRHIAKVEQTLLENPKQTISSAVESLPSFARFRQLHTDKGRHSTNSQAPALERISTTEKRRAGLKFEAAINAVHSREMRVVRSKSFRCLRFFFTVRLLSVRC